MSGVFKKEYFNLLKEYDGVKCNKDDLSHTQVYEILKEANNLTKIWAEKVIDALFDQGHLGGFRNKPTNQGQKFKPYTWAKIYPRKNAPKQLAYTVGIEAHVGFVVKIDTVGDIGIKRNKYELLRGDFDDDSPIIAFLPIDDGLSKNLDELVAWSVEEIQKFGITYDNLCAELELDDENDSSDFTAQLALNFLKNRYVKSEQKTKKIFLCINDLGKELALETGNLATSTVRIFVQEKPPSNIIEAGQCKFIPRNVGNQSPNSNLNTNTATLRSEDNFYQISPKSKVELTQLCNWLDEIGNNLVMENLDNKSKESIKVDKSLNRILFGTAGTGKTYNTINHALSLLDPEYDPQLDRTELKRRFDIYKKQGQIKFVTFHQSFSYEDFVEGIRAETNEEGQLNYDVKAGVFKEICDNAFNQNLPHSNVEEVMHDFCRQVAEQPLKLKTKTGLTYEITYEGGKTLKCFLLESVNKGTYSLSLDTIRKLLHGVELGNYGMPSYIKPIVSLLSNKIQFSDEKSQDIGQKPYVLIIDEINRGNISRIFGELITLIEDTKRQGAEEELSVTLPYSKEEFSVPSNVYIIGTMNSSDRSLTGLDIALRRRFTFIEMPPKPELLNDIEVDGLNIGKLLEIINQRIEVLLDRDHCIGHANFMALTSNSGIKELAQIFKQKVIPQLQEYFFDDWSKINMVLNANGMLKHKLVERSALFPNVESDSEGFLEEQKTWQLVDTAFDSIASFSKIIKH